MHEGHARGTGNLHPGKEVVGAATVGVLAGNGDDLGNNPAGYKTQDRGEDQAIDDLDPLAHIDAVKAAGDGKRAARKASDERVGLRRGNAKDPGHDAPGNNAHGGRRKGDHGQVRVSAKVHHARDGVRNGG